MIKLLHRRIYTLAGLLLTNVCISGQSLTGISVEISTCESVVVKNISNDTQVFFVKDTCEQSSYSSEFEIFRDTYRRHGLSIWYYDTGFATIKKTSTFLNGLEYGLVREFHKNGNLKLVGVCKTIQFFQKKIAGKYWSCRVDLMDTTYQPYRDIKFVIAQFEQYKYNNSFFRKEYRSRYGIALPVEIPLKFGEWKYFNDSGKLERSEYYSGGILIKVISY